MQEDLKDIPLKMVLPFSSTFKQSPKVEKLLADVVYHDNIQMIDFVEQEALNTLYQKAKIFLFPSFHESFGFPPLEAMACGTPVIVSEVTALPEVCADAALYVNPHDKEDIKMKVLALYHDKHLQEVMITKGLERASTFTWQKAAKEYLKVFEEVLGS
jgi:glycosyltransferase involved in cell wall biosynthesis